MDKFSQQPLEYRISHLLNFEKLLVH